jgi:hypothetical protein
MNPVLLFVPFIFATMLAGIAFVPGIMALGLAQATKPVKSDDEATGCLAATHSLWLGAAIPLLAISFGFVGSGLFCVCLNAALMGIALIMTAAAPKAGADWNGDLLGYVYLGVLFLSFLGFFALGMDRLVRWLVPNEAVLPIRPH